MQRLYKILSCPSVELLLQHVNLNWLPFIPHQAFRKNVFPSQKPHLLAGVGVPAYNSSKHVHNNKLNQYHNVSYININTIMYNIHIYTVYIHTYISQISAKNMMLRSFPCTFSPQKKTFLKPPFRNFPHLRHSASAAKAVELSPALEVRPRLEGKPELMATSPEKTQTTQNAIGNPITGWLVGWLVNIPLFTEFYHHPSYTPED